VESTARVTVSEPAHLYLIFLQHDAVNAMRSHSVGYAPQIFPLKS
jgi:hypothetical protein